MTVNSKQVLAAVSLGVLLIVLVYPAISTGTVSVEIRSMKIDRADHVYVTVNRIWAHQKGQTATSAWTLVSNQSQTIDLISLQNSTQSLGSGHVAVASYDSIRLEVSNVTWAFNKTTTNLSTTSSQLDTNLDFIVQAGKGSSITIILGGHQEVIGATKFFITNLNATLKGTP